LKYLDKAVTLWKKTTDYLYDQQAHLYSRDGSYLNKKAKKWYQGILVAGEWLGVGRVSQGIREYAH